MTNTPFRPMAPMARPPQRPMRPQQRPMGMQQPQQRFAPNIASYDAAMTGRSMPEASSTGQLTSPSPYTGLSAYAAPLDQLGTQDPDPNRALNAMMYTRANQRI